MQDAPPSQATGPAPAAPTPEDFDLFAPSPTSDPDDLSLALASTSPPGLSKKALKKQLKRARKAPNTKTKKAQRRAQARALLTDDAPLNFDDFDLDSITPEDLAKMDGQMASRIKDKMDVMSQKIENREVHEGWMRGAIEMAELALRSDETPVGCVFVRGGEVIARGMNGTNATLNGTRHAEFVALSQIIAKYPLSVLQETDLYVTVEPCIMCASALRQFRIRAVYFGCLNERFGGCGGVMRLNSDLPSIDPPYPVYGGIFREEAIMLLRRFYKNRELKTEILPVEVAHSGNPPPVPALTSTKSTDSVPTISTVNPTTTAASTPINGGATAKNGQATSHLIAVPKVLQGSGPATGTSSTLVSPPPNSPVDQSISAIQQSNVGSLAEKVQAIALGSETQDTQKKREQAMAD
ncbi:hypothetical protein B9Z65_4178 [Elsinoe australis]|uniref:tRNA(adenine(34)) deaminase n=1 Tax=Elsinoe australis TaxID=40998 RepID=A0A2P7Z230_9PEZI|nr:hypothetical protein B9Z65_4178 [Elsinoe australis]